MIDYFDKCMITILILLCLGIAASVFFAVKGGMKTVKENKAYEEKIFSECLKDHKQYECELMLRAAKDHNRNHYIPVFIPIR